MARLARQLSITKVYHIMLKGINKEYIFRYDKYKTKFLNILFSMGQEINFEILAYCIMDNHVHLLISVENEFLSLLMKKINVRYAMFYNKSENRNGHVFQNRFRSEEVENEEYYIEAIKYIHNNPVNSNMVNEAIDYKWSSIQEYMGYTSLLIDVNIVENTISRFNGIDDFLRIHNDKNLILFVDTKEEEKQVQEEIIKRIIEDFYYHNNLNPSDKIESKQRNELIYRLFNVKGVTNVKIAEILGMSRFTIDEIKRNKNDQSITKKERPQMWGK